MKNESRVRIFRPPNPSRWSGAAPSAFVILALLALLLVPMLVQGRVDRLRQEIEESAEPSRALLAEVQYLLARQSSAVRGYLVTRSPDQLDQYTRFVARENQIYPELEAHAAELGASIVGDIAELRALSMHWHERLMLADLPEESITPEAFEAALEQELYLRTLEAAGRADLALRGAVLERRHEIRRVEITAGVAYFLLFVVGLGAAVAVAMLNARIRRLAEEANERRLEVERALDETARALEGRASLIRGFTHDVKNPLGAADGFADLLASGIRGELTETQAETVARIRAAIRGAIEIIDELLDLSRLESGGLHLRREAVELGSLTKEAIRHQAGAAAREGLEITLRVDENEDLVAYTDRDRVRQVLGNLLSNAVKYTPAPGTVVVAIHRNPSDPPRAGSWVAISVTDSGVGIPKEELERIFDEFHRVPGSTGRGHGLGLAISRRVARLLGGDVTVRSTLGEGSVFVLWLPIRDVVEEGGPAHA